MCGIAGFVTGKERKRNATDFIKDSFIAGQVRGTDSCGLATVDTVRSNAGWYKMPYNGTMFVEDRYTKQLLNYVDDPFTITIGHTRSATSGKIGINQSHPFIIQDTAGREMIGVHNGTLKNWSSRKDAKDYEVDSEWALNLIFDKGDDAFAEFDGAFVFVWWDSADKDVLNIALNKERPMFIAFLEDGGMAYASEAGMLYWLINRNDMKVKGQALQLLEGHHYRFNVNDLEAFQRDEIELYKAPASSSSSKYGYEYTNFAKVEKVLGYLMEEAKKEEVKDEHPKSPRLTQQEVSNAKDLLMYNTKGVFVPWWSDTATGEVHGTFETLDQAEFNAVIRNAANIEWDYGMTWEVSCLGVIDDNNNLTVVCSKPRVQLVIDNDKIATQH